MLRFLSSLQARLVAGFAVALSVALLSVGWYVSGEAGREAERSEALRMEVRVERVRSALDERLAEGRGWSGIQPDVERLGRLLSARVLVWDGNEKLIGGLPQDGWARGRWDSGENWGATTLLRKVGTPWDRGPDVPEAIDFREESFWSRWTPTWPIT